MNENENLLATNEEISKLGLIVQDESFIDDPSLTNLSKVITYFTGSSADIMGGALMRDVETQVQIGNIPSGVTLSKGLTFTELVERAFTGIVFPSITVSNVPEKVLPGKGFEATVNSVAGSEDLGSLTVYREDEMVYFEEEPETTSNVPVDMSSCEEGTYRLKFIVRDVDGRRAISDKIVAVEKLVLPSADIAGVPSDPVAYKGSFNITVTPYAGDLDLDKLIYVVDGKEVSEEISPIVSGTACSPYTISCENIQSGKHTVGAKVFDIEGNFAIIEEEFNVAEAPVLKVTLSNVSRTVKAGRSFTASAKVFKGAGELRKLEFIIDNKVVKTINSIADQGVYDYTHEASIKEKGDRIITAKVYDEFGFASTAALFTVIEVVKPYLELRLSSAEITTAETAELSAIATEKTNPLESLTFKIDGATVKTVTPVVSKEEYSLIIDGSTLSVGQHIITVEVADNDGYVSSRVKEFIVKPAKILSITVTGVKDITNSDSFTANAVVSAGYSPLSRLEFILDGNIVDIRTPVLPDVNYTYTQSGALLPMGQHTFAAKVYDTNSASAIDSHNFNVASVVMPSVTLSGVPASITKGETFTASATPVAGTNALQKLEFYVDNSLVYTDYSPVSGTTSTYVQETAAMAEGSHNFLVKIYDVANNNRTDSKNFVVAGVTSAKRYFGFWDCDAEPDVYIEKGTDYVQSAEYTWNYNIATEWSKPVYKYPASYGDLKYIISPGIAGDTLNLDDPQYSSWVITSETIDSIPYNVYTFKDASDFTEVEKYVFTAKEQQ